MAVEAFHLRTEIIEKVHAERGVFKEDVAYGSLVYFKDFGAGLYGKSAGVARVAAKEGLGLNDDRPVIPFGDGIGVVVARCRHLNVSFQNETEPSTHFVLLEKRLPAFDAVESQTNAAGDIEEVFAAEALKERQEQDVVEEGARAGHMDEVKR